MPCVQLEDVSIFGQMNVWCPEIKNGMFHSVNHMIEGKLYPPTTSSPLLATMSSPFQVPRQHGVMVSILDCRTCERVASTLKCNAKWSCPRICWWQLNIKLQAHNTNCFKDFPLNVKQIIEQWRIGRACWCWNDSWMPHQLWSGLFLASIYSESSKVNLRQEIEINTLYMNTHHFLCKYCKSRFFLFLYVDLIGFDFGFTFLSYKWMFN